ncbi:MAG: PQQ-binding-like beta-propeller repeat protein [Maricaulis sp.]|uniref:PQQ-like beta-propeller repeat protein n=1 Tax=Maricaulis sp. TaxID=1486257 RepID=UPI001B25056D|nr:PQQ-like beta-propeller repeat protein [Maricaulis sp.]MBO6728284.1 PQQ-binding-like beta-propeller repeat protein [Maricaulis sp.]MBO6847896.1 PQQ-binding-like beta-propeller repeat protein [Maricaulis sp.]MBO6877519.1 PQQ-binding-like beta-propeller repeat protein [Maricaulis sp.]
MIDVKRTRSLLLALALAPIAACSSIPNPGDALDFIPGIGGNDDAPEDTAPQDGRISILDFETGLQAASGEALPPVQLPTAYVNSVWPGPDGYPTHALQHTQATGSLDIMWRQTFGEGSDHNQRLNARPVVAEGRVYMIDARGEVSAIDAESGERLWSRRLEGPNERDRMSFGGGIAFDSGRIYAHSGYNYLVALDAQSGSEIWRSEIIVPFHGAPTVADGRIFVASDDNEMLSIDASNGNVNWTYQGIIESARLITSPSPAVLGDIVVAPFASGEIVALRVQNGNPLWSDSLSGSGTMTAMSEINDVAGSPIIVDNTVYAMSHSGTMVAISLRSGERLWELPAGGLHAPWVAGDYLYVVTTEAQVVCINRQSGQVHWITQLQQFENMRKREDRIAWSGPVLAGGRVFVTSSHGEAVLLNAYDGSEMREYQLRDNVFVAPVIANETIYIVTDEARVIALR